MALQIKNIPKFREFECSRKDFTNLDPDFIGHEYIDPETNKVTFGFFDHINGRTETIRNKLTTNLNMAQDTQAIFEFVQNAVDANSSDFFMYYDEERFIALNNGDTFTEKDILSILSVGASNKTSPQDEEMIGRFGVGFKLIHRMVGAQSGVDELINEYAGPIMFSWHNREQLEELRQIENLTDLQLGSENLNGDEPWLFKFLLTCFPMVPEKYDVDVKDINYDSITKKEKLIFGENEFDEFVTFLNNFWAVRYEELEESDLSTGSLFYLKLGKGKKKKLDEDFDFYRSGLNYSLRFIETLRKSDSLKTIFFNRHDPITADNVNLQVDAPIIIKSEDEDYREIQEFLEEKDQGIDIKFRYAYEAYSGEIEEEIGLLRNEPNFFKYFPMGKEKHQLNFVLHCNAFNIETSRREFQQDDELNKKLLSVFTKHFIDRLKDYRTQNRKLYKDLFLSVLLSGQNGIKEQWIKERLFWPLLKEFKEHVPVKKERYAPAKNVAMKNSSLDIPADILRDKVEWFDFEEDGNIHDTIKDAAYDIMNIKVWNVATIISKIEKDHFVEWLDQLSDKDKRILKDELKECIDGTLGSDFWKNAQEIKGIFELVKNCDSNSAKQNFLKSFGRIELKAEEVNSENTTLIELLSLAKPFIKEEEFSEAFRGQFVVISTSGKEYPLKEVATKDEVGFDLDGEKIVLKLSEILPNSFKETSGVFAPVYKALKKLEVDVDILFDIGSERNKNAIKNEIDRSETGLTAAQLTFLLIYSVQKNKKLFGEVDQELIGPTLEYLFQNKLPFPKQFQNFVIEKGLSDCIYPNEFGLESEYLISPLIEWLESTKSEISNRVAFLEKNGLKTEKHPHVKLRRSIIKNYADSKQTGLIDELREVKDFSRLFEFLSVHEAHLTGFTKSVLAKIITSAKAKSVGRSSVPLPVIVEVSGHEPTIQPLLKDHLAEGDIYLITENNKESPNYNLDDILKTISDNDFYLVDAEYTEQFYTNGLKEIKIVSQNDVEIGKQQRLNLSHRFIKEWERSDIKYSLHLFEGKIPQCYQFDGFVFKRYEENYFNLDDQTETVFIGGITDTFEDEENLYGLIKGKMNDNASANDAVQNILNDYKKIDPNEARNRRSDDYFYKQLTRESKINSGEWLENSILWEKARKEENYYRGTKLKFNSVKSASTGTIVLSKYMYDTIPGFLEVFEELKHVEIYSENTSDKIKISASVIEVGDFEIELRLLEGASKNELASFCRDPKIKAFIKLPKTDPWLTGLHHELFANELIVKDDDLKDRITKKWDSNSLGFIFGPPGTGKTTKSVILSLLALAQAKENDGQAKVLTLTPTNKAADVFIEKCLDLIHEPDQLLELDIGFSQQENELLISFLKSDFSSEIVYRFGNSKSDKIPSTLVGRSLPSGNQTLVATTIHRYVFNDPVRVYLNGSEDCDEYLIIDEASMVPLAYALHALLTVNSQTEVGNSKLPKVTIAGDPFQIKPVGMTPHPGETAYKGWTTVSLYSLLDLKKFNIEKTPIGGYKIDNLKTQYRSNRIIGELYSKYLYNGLLSHYYDKTPGELDKKFKDEIYYLNFDVHGVDNESNPITKLNKYRKYSIYHIYSCVLAIELADRISSVVGDKESILLLSPYGIQARILRDILENDESRFGNANISASTVHGAQGDQADHVILVQNPSKISNSSATFFNNKNLINVAISRAKKKLFILAPDPSSLRKVNEIDQEVLTNEHPVSRFDQYNFEEEYFGSKNAFKDQIGVSNFNDFLIEDISTAIFTKEKYKFYVGDGKVFCWFNSEK
ncbi:MAG: hypothetical protein CL666_07500 [Balneola sp.]|nr:hypothetical protein [Balneola sp.]|tara:strand:+ start:4075 stop:9426 length:5352 start_codon:yes stop_codon:yes gene_type:complete